MIAVAWVDIEFIFASDPLDWGLPEHNQARAICGFFFWILLTVPFYPIIVMTIEHFTHTKLTGPVKKGTIEGSGFMGLTSNALNVAFGLAPGVAISNWMSKMKTWIIFVEVPGAFEVKYSWTQATGSQTQSLAETYYWKTAHYGTSPLAEFENPASGTKLAVDTIQLTNDSKNVLVLAAIVLFGVITVVVCMIFVALGDFATKAIGPLDESKHAPNSCCFLVRKYIITFFTLLNAGLVVPFAKPWYFSVQLLVAWMQEQYAYSSCTDPNSCNIYLLTDLYTAMISSGLCYTLSFKLAPATLPDDSDIVKQLKSFYTQTWIVLAGYSITGFFQLLCQYYVNWNLGREAASLPGIMVLFTYAVVLTAFVILYVWFFCKGDFTPDDEKDPSGWHRHFLEVNAWLISYAWWYPFDSLFYYMARQTATVDNWLLKNPTHCFLGDSDNISGDELKYRVLGTLIMCAWGIMWTLGFACIFYGVFTCVENSHFGKTHEERSAEKKDRESAVVMGKI